MRNAESIAIGEISLLSFDDFRESVIQATECGARISALFGQPLNERVIRLIAVLSRDTLGSLTVVSCEIGKSYQALTPDCPQAHLFECEIAEQWAVRPEGHPWLKSVRKLRSAGTFLKVPREDMHEVAVGPVHAGIIEPGHFRFQCRGEIVSHLEIALGYQHRGIERVIVGGPHKRTLHQMEALAGDTSAGHAMAYCQAVESLSGTAVPGRADALRGICLELERMANHAGDLGALAGDVGYLPTASFCGRLRGSFLNMSALLCGNRFTRGMIVPGGVSVDVDESRLERLASQLSETMRDLTQAVSLLWETPSVMARFEETGSVDLATCQEIGLVGPAARACGAEYDARSDFPTGVYRFTSIPTSSWHTGDVFARAFVRWLEIQRSAAFISEQVKSLPRGPMRWPVQPMEPSCATVSLVEGWRGEICHVAMTDEAGRFSSYKIVDPSFHNWFGLAMAMRNQQISDFPLCNKSFNLSYCGHDL